MSGFVPGLALSRRFYEEVVAPAVGAPHGAALLGPGSDVVGYDTQRSTDHDWGPRCQLFVQASDLDEVGLPLLMGRRYASYSKWLGTAFAGLPDPNGLGSSLAEAVAPGTLIAREGALGRAYQLLAERFNALSPGSRLDTTLRPFHDRPALVLGAGRFAAASLERVEDPVLTRLSWTAAGSALDRSSERSVHARGR